MFNECQRMEARNVIRVARACETIVSFSSIKTLACDIFPGEKRLVDLLVYQNRSDDFVVFIKKPERFLTTLNMLQVRGNGCENLRRIFYVSKSLSHAATKCYVGGRFGVDVDKYSSTVKFFRQDSLGDGKIRDIRVIDHFLGT